MVHSSIVVMGVTGSGKSRIGASLATRIGAPFIDGDDLHPAANKQKMAAGIALNDADRAPWLDAIASVLGRAPVVVACSALKRRYRDRLRKAAPDFRLLYLEGPAATLAQRLGARSHEFMPAGLLESQLATLEPPGTDEGALTLDIRLSPRAIVDCAAEWLTA